MIFVVTNPFVSSLLRGKHIADELGSRTLFASIGGARNQPIVFVKDADPELVSAAKDRGNRILYDPLDQYCKAGRACQFAGLVDVVILPNRASAAFYRANGFPEAAFAVIPHQWDHRIKGEARQDQCRPGYIGHSFNCPPGWEGAKVVDMGGDISADFARFNLHLSLNARNPAHALLKPAVKVASAAAVLANVVAYPDPSALELLGPDYPFYVDSDPMAAIRMARESFGGVDWLRGREKMKEVRERTSLQAIVGLYRRLADRDPSMLDAPLAEAA